MICSTGLKAIAILVLYICPFSSEGQWLPTGVPFRILEVANIHKDTIADVLYFCGESSLNNDFDFSDGAVPVYADGQWDTLGVFGGRVQTAVRWNDTLIVGGSFSGVDGIPAPRKIAYWNGFGWLPFGEFSDSIYRLKVINGELYAIGAFEFADGVYCNGVAKRQDGYWVNVGTMDTYTPSIIQDLVEYEGVLYATGVIRFTPDGAKDIAYFNGTEWLALGDGILGGFGAGRSLAVYRDELYVGGSIPIGAGNAGHGIMRWNGQAFQPVGSGFQGSDNGFTYLVGSVEMEVHDDLLWACGTFSYAGNAPARIATWDGARWCGLPAGLEQEINSIEFFHDTLFASCSMLNGEPVNCAVRFTGETYSDTCSLALGGAGGRSGEGHSLHAYRRSDGAVDLLGVPDGEHLVEAFDPAGRLLYSQQVLVRDDGPVAFWLPAVPMGMAMIKVGAAGTVRFIGP